MRDLENLAGLIPRDLLSPTTRQRFERAFATSGDLLGKRAAARDAVRELLQCGELVKVDLSSRIAARRTLYMLRGSNRLVDLAELAPLQAEGHAEAPVEGVAVAPAVTDEPRLDASVEPLDMGADRSGDKSPFGTMYGMLEAMEHAQDLQIGDPRNRETGVLVERILALLQSTIAQVSIHAQLHGLEAVPEDAQRLIPAQPQQREAFWQRHRAAGQAIWISELRELPDPLGRNIAARLTTEAVTAAVPIVAPFDPTVEIGLLYVSARPNWQKGRLLALAQRLARFVSNRWRTQHDVNRRVHTDSLTGLHNRAYFDLHFSLELERARRAGLPLALVLGDLDRFKSINDTYGHPFGDRVLRMVAQSLQSTLRRIDHVCRIGGEEFACLLPSTTIGEAREVLSRLIAQPLMLDLPSQEDSARLPVTLSYGVVCYPDAGAGTAELQRKADNMLYQAKRLGRNRCCLWMSDGRHLHLTPSTAPAVLD